MDLYPPMPPPPQPASIQTVNQVAVGLLYRTTGSPKVLGNGLWPPAVVTRVKVIPPSLETDTAEKLLAWRLANRCRRRPPGGGYLDWPKCMSPIG